MEFSHGIHVEREFFLKIPGRVPIVCHRADVDAAVAADADGSPSRQGHVPSQPLHPPHMRRDEQIESHVCDVITNKLPIHSYLHTVTSRECCRYGIFQLPASSLLVKLACVAASQRPGSSLPRVCEWCHASKATTAPCILDNLASRRRVSYGRSQQTAAITNMQMPLENNRIAAIDQRLLLIWHQIYFAIITCISILNDHGNAHWFYFF